MDMDQIELQKAFLLHRQGRLAEAAHIYEQMIKRNPDNVDALHFLGTIKASFGQLSEAKTLIERSLSNNRVNISFLENFIAVLFQIGDYGRAIDECEKALGLDIKNRNFLYVLAASLLKIEKPREALEQFNSLLKLYPNDLAGLNEKASALAELGQYEEALLYIEKAVATNPKYAEALLNKGNLLAKLKRYDDAIVAYDRALLADPKMVAIYAGRGNALGRLGRHDEALADYAKVVEIEPRYPFAKGRLLHEKMLTCNWQGVNDLIKEIESDMASNKLSSHPFSWMGVATSERSMQLCARLYSESEFPPKIHQYNRLVANNKSKIRVGYLSGEFRDQATSHLLVGVLEEHDDTQFEIYAFDNGWDDQSEIRQRINRSVHNIIDISRLSDASAATTIYKNEIDVLVNLNGYFGDHRMPVFAQRPAPIQVNYLGFPGTLGASYIHYIIADRHVIPENHKVFYTEKVVYLPNCYQANDRKKKIGSRNFSRQECGLPDKDFVFCCFNNNYKIMPEVFDCWMRILSKADDSVLWLIEDNFSATVNLKREAAKRGVSSERLVFAKRILPEDHLARHQLADLFLDTWPCNAHTTASDALWAGLPVLTHVGETFAGKVAASLLSAADLRELIASTSQMYEDLAIQFYNDSKKLAATRQKLANRRLQTPLFDTQLLTRHIEAAYTAMYRRHKAGLSPDHMHVPQ
jgi:predicted O-linked N-acetylglucosamine transferase (SPINDLY family)